MNYRSMTARARFTGASVAGLGVALVGVSALRMRHHVTTTEVSTWVVVAGAIPLLVVAAGLVLGGGWVARADADGRWMAHVVGWTIAGLLIAVSLTGLALVYLRSIDMLSGDPWYPLLVTAGIGANAGLLIGVQSFQGRQRDRRLRKSEETIEFLHRILRHNVLNATQIITGYAHELRTEEADPGETKPLSIIEHQGDRIATLVDNVRALTLAETDQTVNGPVSLDSMVDRILDEMEQATPNAHIERSLDPVTVEANELLDVAVGNVVENAVVHNDALRPTVDVSLSAVGSRAELTIADNGPGLEGESPGDLFDPGDHGDAGLGLYLAQRIVVDSGGEISVDSNEYGGTTVRILLPRCTPESPSRDRESVPAAG